MDSLYSDLLNDYLNFFLPVYQREVKFPCLNSQNSSSALTVSNPLSKPLLSTLSSTSVYSQATSYSYNQSHPHLFQRMLYKNSSTVDLVNDFSIKGAVTSMSSNEQIKSQSSDLHKIDTFLQLINQLLILPFSFRTSETSPDSNSNIQTDNLSSLKISTVNCNFKVHDFKNRKNLSPSKYDDSKPNLCNLEIVFVLRMVLRHSHLFACAFQPIESIESTLINDATFTKNRSSLQRSLNASGAQIYSSSLDELRK